MPRSTRVSTAASPRERIVAYLSEHGGRVESPNGLGLTTSMAAGTGYTQVAALNAMLVRLERDGVITRDVKGKRTYAISLPKRRGAAKPAASPIPKTRPAAPSATGRGRRAAAKSAAPTAGDSLADQVASLRRDADALARNVRALQNVVTAGR